MILIYALLSYLIWSYLHEYAHISMAEYCVGVREYSLKLYPHKHPKLGFVFASASYTLEREPSDYEDALISFAPRYLNALAVLFFPFCSESLFLSVLVGGGLVDLIRGSFIFCATSDIKRYCEGWKWDYLLTMAIQLLGVAISALLYLG